MIANVVKDLIATVRTLSTGAPKVSGTIYVAIRLELDGDADGGKRWCTTHSAWETTPHAFPEATYDAAGDWIYQAPAGMTTSKVSATKPARLHWRMTDNVTTPASETASSGENEEMVYSSGAAEAATGAAASVTAGVTLAADQAVNATKLAGQTITAAAGVTFPSSVASPTNITAGTITTCTNLTNAPTSGDLTATMKASVNAEVVDAMTVDAVAELTADPGSTTSLTKMVMALYMKIRNLETSTATANTIANNAGTTIMTATKSDDGTTFTKNKWA